MHCNENALDHWLATLAEGKEAEKKVGKGDKLLCEGYLLPVRTFEKKDGGIGHSLEFTAFSVKALQWSPQDLSELPSQTPDELEATAPETADEK